MQQAVLLAASNHPKIIRRSARGFNLVEAAIVLGVVGLVIGGIWITASEVSKTRKVNDLYRGTMQIISNLQALYASSPQAGGGIPKTYEMYLAGIIPADVFTYNSSTGNFTYDMHDPGAFQVATMAIYLNASSPNFEIQMRAMERSTCIRFLNMMGRANLQQLGVTQVATTAYVYNTSTSDYTITADEVDTACNTSAKRDLIIIRANR